jgi:hypothetical protein
LLGAREARSAAEGQLAKEEKVTKEDIKLIIRAQGYAVWFMVQRHHSGHARTPDRYYVCVLQGKTKRILGRLDAIAQMSEEELIRRLEAKAGRQEAMSHYD